MIVVLVFFQKSCLLTVLSIINGELHWKTADLAWVGDFWKTLIDGCALYIFSALSCVGSLIIYPLGITLEKLVGAHSYGFGYGLGWGAAFFFLAAAICMCLDDVVRGISKGFCCCRKSRGRLQRMTPRSRVVIATNQPNQQSYPGNQPQTEREYLYLQTSRSNPPRIGKDGRGS